MSEQAPIHNAGNNGEPQPHTQQQPAPTGANAYQVAGNHYKQFTHETWDVIMDWGLGYLDGNAVKYLSRWRHKGGVEDLKKARHYIDKLIETEEARHGSNPGKQG